MSKEATVSLFVSARVRDEDRLGWVVCLWGGGWRYVRVLLPLGRDSGGKKDDSLPIVNLGFDCSRGVAVRITTPGVYLLS